MRPRMKGVGLLRNILLSGLLLLALLAIFLQGLRGAYSLQVILSGSMLPALSVGSLVVSKSVPPEQYQEGDVITFLAPQKERTLVTHRLVKLQRTTQGVLVARTKGDANTNGDSWQISMGSIIGKKVASLPVAGYGLYLVRTPIGFLVLAFLFFLLLVQPELYFIKMWLGELRNSLP